MNDEENEFGVAAFFGVAGPADDIDLVEHRPPSVIHGGNTPGGEELDLYLRLYR